MERCLATAIALLPLLIASAVQAESGGDLRGQVCHMIDAAAAPSRQSSAR